MPAKYPRSLRVKVLKRYVAGEDPFDLAKEFGVHVTTIRKWGYRSGYKRAPTPNKYTVKQRREAIELYKAGFSTAQVEHQTGVSRHTLVSWLEDEGIPRRRPQNYSIQRIPQSEFDFAVRMYRKGYTLREIGEMLGGRHYTGVARMLRIAGEPIRTKEEQMRISYERKRRLTPSQYKKLKDAQEANAA